MADHYILDGHEPKAVPLMEWALWLEKAQKERIVEQTTVGDVKVSTVFLGLNHKYGEGAPLLFETMIFGGDLDGECDRYSTWDEAVKGHHFYCEKAFAQP